MPPKEASRKELEFPANYFCYVDTKGNYRKITIEIQLFIFNEELTWHVQVFEGDPAKNDKAICRYYNFKNRHLYDCVVESVMNVDLLTGSSFYPSTILQGYWTKAGNAIKVQNKRLWYYEMFNNLFVRTIAQDLTQDERKILNKFL
jgi:hypothetical protein